MAKHSPRIELDSLKSKLQCLERECMHWDYEDEYPECEHADEVNSLRRSIKKLRQTIATT